MNDGISDMTPFATQALLDEVKTWVEIESPSIDAVAVNRLMDKIEADANAAGASMKRIPGRDGYGDQLLVTSPWGGEEPGVLVVSHVDTVHPVGTLTRELPFRVEGDIAYGPGIYDMKGGAVIAFAALRHLIRVGGPGKLPIRHLFVPDEEVGSPTSRELIEEEARRASYVLVTEPARDGGKIVTSRKGGTATFDLTVTGRSEHSLHPKNGRSAVRELARQILELESMSDYDTGLTVNVGVIGGGTSTSMVPGHAYAKISMSAPDSEITEKTIARVLALKSNDPDVTIEITAERGRRPGYEKSPEIEALFQHARGLAAEIGFVLEGVNGPIGGDANFTAQFAPTLDGMGPDGKGAHGLQEQISISSLVPRATLLLRLFETLG
ncbi:M20 family metallopeptidase [Mesorhizobium sp. M0029]|uniref:M20 family metallopeptidase n=1 Tax=Mesorhizobium sp. M0029 TaxID=2956850 RepID=UPI0033363810